MMVAKVCALQGSLWQEYRIAVHPPDLTKMAVKTCMGTPLYTRAPRQRACICKELRRIPLHKKCTTLLIRNQAAQ
jgi:hypothetical protein